MRLIKWLDEHLEETLMIILLIIIACVTMIQVIVRKVPWLTSLTWAEEFCRFMWIWSVFISLPYTIRMENMLRVGVLVDLLRHPSGKITFPLLGYDIGYQALAGLEVIGHRFGLIGGAVVVKHRLSRHIAGRVGRTHGIYHACGHIHLYLGGIELYLVVGHLAVTEHKSPVSAYDHHRILSLEVHRIVKIALGAVNALAPQ